MMSVCFFLIITRHPRTTRTDTLFPNTTLFRAQQGSRRGGAVQGRQRGLRGAARPAEARRLRPAAHPRLPTRRRGAAARSEEHTSELQSLMRISYAVFCLKKKKSPHTFLPYTSIF